MYRLLRAAAWLNEVLRALPAEQRNANDLEGVCQVAEITGWLFPGARGFQEMATPIRSSPELHVSQVC